MASQTKLTAVRLPVEGNLPSLGGATEWLIRLHCRRRTFAERSSSSTSGPRPASIGCAKLPYVRAWAEKYKDQGLVVIGVHARNSNLRKTSTAFGEP